MNDFKNIIKSSGPYSRQQMEGIMTLIMEGRIPDNDLKDFLLALNARGETAEEITGAARVLRNKALKISAPEDAVDCCGTGGDMSGTYNISTAVAFVAAACGVPVAKHGNRASSSKSGAADVLQALDINLDIPQQKLEEALRRFNFAFLMAPHHHHAMKYVRDVRKKIGRRTIFNLLGPLANPAGTRYQLIGVYSRHLLRPFAEVLRSLGTKRAWVVHGADGMDEITTTGKTYIAILHEDGSIEEKTLKPGDFDLPEVAPEALRGGNAKENARALKALLEGRTFPYRDIVLVNTAAVLCIHGSAKDLKNGIKMAAEAIDEGRALKLLEDYRDFSNQEGLKAP